MRTGGFFDDDGKNEKTYQKVYVLFGYIKNYMYLCNVIINKMFNKKNQENERRT